MAKPLVAAGSRRASHHALRTNPSAPDTEIARVTRIGFPAPEATVIIDHGGTPGLVEPGQLNCGMAMFTLLHGVCRRLDAVRPGR